MEKLLSSAGKEVLIKSVAQAIPVFSVSCFRLHRGICQSGTSILRQFWWGEQAGEEKTMLGVVGRPDMVKKLGRTRISLSGGFQFGLAVTAGLAHH